MVPAPVEFVVTMLSAFGRAVLFVAQFVLGASLAESVNAVASGVLVSASAALSVPVLPSEEALVSVPDAASVDAPPSAAVLDGAGSLSLLQAPNTMAALTHRPKPHPMDFML